MVGMLAFLELLDLLPPREILVADAARLLLLGCIIYSVPCLLGDGFYLVGLKPLAYFSIFLFELKQLLIGHLVRVGTGIALALLDGLLEHSLLLFLSRSLLALELDVGEHELHHQLPLAVPLVGLFLIVLLVLCQTFLELLDPFEGI